MLKREKAYEKNRTERAEKRAARGAGAAEAQGETKIGKKMDEMYESIEKKQPKVAQYLSYFKEVWDETFPSPEKEMAKRMNIRKN